MKPAKPPYDRPRRHERRWWDNPSDGIDWLILISAATVGAALIYFAFHR